MRFDFDTEGHAYLEDPPQPCSRIYRMRVKELVGHAMSSRQTLILHASIVPNIRPLATLKCQVPAGNPSNCIRAFSLWSFLD
jgi:hypothetical protein